MFMLTRISPSRQLAPGPPRYPLVGNLPDFQKDALGFMLRMVRDYGDVVQLQLGPETVFLLGSPDHARTVFLDRDGVFSKGGRWKTLKMLLGEGMLTSDGEPWRRKRRVVEPAFHRSQLSQLT
ncbi:MAG: cytochrome P450, partial [Myxococcota bacterium]